MPGLSLVLKVLANAKLPDALRLSGLRGSCNILNLHDLVGRIRRSLNCTPNVGHNLTSEGAVYETFI